MKRMKIALIISSIKEANADWLKCHVISQHNGCQRSRAALEDALNQEKTKAHNTIKDLERKLREHQEAILAKIQECNQSRDLAVALKQEIDSYRALLDGEERR